MRARGLTLRALKFIAKNVQIGSPIARINVVRIMLVTYTLDMMLTYLQPGVVRGSESIPCLMTNQTLPESIKSDGTKLGES